VGILYELQNKERENEGYLRELERMQKFERAMETATISRNGQEDNLMLPSLEHSLEDIRSPG